MIMEKSLSFRLLSLKEISLRRVVVILWCQPDILASLDISGAAYEVDVSINQFELPALLSEQLKDLIIPIGSEIRNWKQFHEMYLKIGNINLFYILKHLCWTMLGTVDYRKTAEIVIHREMLDVVKRYRLACLYCLDEYIPILWEKLPRERKIYFYKEEGPWGLVDPQLEFCWPYILKGEGSILDCVPLNPFGERVTFNQCAFEYSACTGNKAATEYFFGKLPSDAREDSLMRIVEEVLTLRFDDHVDRNKYSFPEKNISDTFCYLTPFMKPEQQMEIFENLACEALACLLEWPWQDLFLDILELVWNFLDADGFVSLLKMIVYKIRAGYHITNLFYELFLRGSSDFIKEFVEHECRSGSVLLGFLDVEDSEAIKVIFRKLDSADRKTLILSQPVVKLFLKLILKGESYLVVPCLQEATLSEEDKEELKEVYFRSLPEINKLDEFPSDINLKRREHNWKEFLPFLD